MAERSREQNTMCLSTQSSKKGMFMAIINLFGIVNLLCFIGNANALAIDRPTFIVEKPSASGKDICQTPGCVHAASMILENLDLNVNPCDDFYGFACGNFVRDSVIPDYKSSISTFSKINDRLQHQLRTTVEKEAKDTDPRAFKLVQSLYNSCMNLTQIDLNSDNEFMDILKSLGGWPVLLGDSWDESKFDWLDIMYKCRKHGFSFDYFVALGIDVDLKDNKKRVLVIDQAQLDLPHEYLSNGLSDKVVQAYYKLMVDLAEFFGAERTKAKVELLDVLKFQIELAKISLPSEKRRDATLLYNPMTVSQLSHQYPYLPWKDYINTILKPHARIEDDEAIIVAVPSFLDSLEKLLTQTSKRTLANYALWNVLSESSDTLSQKVQDIVRDFEMIVTGTNIKLPRWNECVKDLTGNLNLATSALYVKNYFDENAKNNAVEMINNLRKSFKNILLELTWMDEKTKSSALEKLQSMVSHIAYPDELLDDKKIDDFYKNLTIVDNSYFKSKLNIKYFETEYVLDNFRKPVNKSDWILHGTAAIVNAFYSPTENSIQFPAGILQGAFFAHDRPKYLNYGGIGFVMGHEITHGFDDQGRQFDKNGNLVEWWQKDTKDKYLQKAQCIIDQYSNFTVEEVGLKINGINTQGENIADNGGIKEAYYAYRDWESRNGVEPKLPGLNNYTSEQMFWISAATVWCGKMRPEALRSSVITDVHSPGEYRVRGPFSNMVEFSKDFNCPANAEMNPDKKCSVW